MRQKMHMITLGVDDMDRAIQFYEKGLGWRRSAVSTGDLIVFSLGSMVLALYPRHLLAEDACVQDEPTGFPGVTLSYNATNEAEVDAVMREVEMLGAEIIKPAQKVFWGGYSGYFRDPDGHLVEVAHNPFWKLDENGDIDISIHEQKEEN
jgi:uncharacterized protein